MTAVKRTVRLRITGVVQGVCFRVWTAETARALKLDGWVRNRRDGSVEALFSGDAQVVAAMMEQCRMGPPAAEVESVEIVEEVGGAPQGFELRPTA
jgi:acylphosphatase